MTRLITYASLLFTGMVLGWWLRDYAPSGSPLQLQIPMPASITQVVAPTPSNTPPAKLIADTRSHPTIETIKSPDPAQLEQLLSEREFELAIAYYENALKSDDGYQALLKPKVEDYLKASLDQCTNGAFVELVDLWLDAYYADIPVLLLLAENQRLCSSPEEAARTLQMARTYAIQSGSQDKVTAAVTDLIAATDTNLSQQKDWIALLGFYEFLQTIDLATNTSQLRRAALYQVVGEQQRSHDLLSELREQDDGLDAQWTAALNLQWTETEKESAVDDLPAYAVPLTRAGDHFLVSALINDASPVTLMIDTGASVTTLSRNSFAQIDSANFSYRGSRLFNTANGMTQGDVYEAASLTLGNTQLRDLEIAVLDYASANGIDGLLGMNALRNYRFEVDQDKEVLFLHRRR